MNERIRETYSKKDTEELVYLYSRRGLTDVALEIMNEELAKRGIGEHEINLIIEKFDTAQKSIKVTSTNLASRGRRLVAKIIDTLGVLLVLSVLNFLIYLTVPKTFSDIVGNISIVAFMGYLLFKDGFNGQSIGKKLLKIKVIEESSGEPCSLPRSFVRNLLGFFGIFDWIFIFGNTHRRLGDHAAGTSVTYLDN